MNKYKLTTFIGGDFSEKREVIVMDKYNMRTLIGWNYRWKQKKRGETDEEI
ncbi:MAG: hypothetical protein U9N77_06835 [Thermodesulfobacteriota bacterium]|nr:hypothetical protein [Thermodesulfobacteriota bacterium]